MKTIRMKGVAYSVRNREANKITRYKQSDDGTAFKLFKFVSDRKTVSRKRFPQTRSSREATIIVELTVASSNFYWEYMRLSCEFITALKSLKCG